MHLLRTILVTVTLAFWLAGSNHCRLEQLPGMEFLACDATAVTSQAPCESSECSGHPEEEDSGCAKDTCADDSCALVEDGAYASGAVRVKTSAPLLCSASPALPAEADTAHFALPPQVILLSHPDSPPEPVHDWRFSERAAAPPRSPSHAA